MIIGPDRVRVHRIGQRKAASEGAVGALDAKVIAFIFLALELAFATNGENVALDANVEFLRIDIRQIRLDDQRVFIFADINGRRPGRQIRLLLACVIEELGEDAIELIELVPRKGSQRLRLSILTVLLLHVMLTTGES